MALQQTKFILTEDLIRAPGTTSQPILPVPLSLPLHPAPGNSTGLRTWLRRSPWR